MLQNTMRSITVIGLYGAKNGHLVQPDDPGCHLVIVIKAVFGRLLYFVERGDFSPVDTDDKIPNQHCWSEEETSCFGEFRKIINEYIEAGEIIIAKNQETEFGKLALPLLRCSYPKLVVNDLISVQPMSAPAGLAWYLSALRTKEGQGEPREGQEKA